MESIRLYAFRVLVFSLLLPIFISCSESDEEKKVGSVFNQSQSDDNLSEKNITTTTNSFYFSEASPVMGKEKSIIRYRRHIIGQHEIYLFDKYYIYSYVIDLNCFCKRFKVAIDYDYTNFPTGKDFYFVDNRLIETNKESISPNTGVAIYKNGNIYISQYKENKGGFKIIYSADLVHWTIAPLDCPAPILFFEKEDSLFALAANEIWNVRNPEEPLVIKKLSETILRPLPGEPHYAVRDETVFYAFNLDAHIFAYIERIYEDGPQRYFLVLDTDDFTFTLSKVTEEFRGPYLEKAVKRDDGWKIYFISTEKILVIDPFTGDGPAIIEELPGSQN